MSTREEIEKFIKEELLNIIRLMGFEEYQPELEIVNTVENIQLNLNFTDRNISSMLIGRDGKTLRALNIILQAITFHHFKDELDKIPKISVDINQYNSRFEQKIKVIVEKAIQQVKQTNKAYKFQPMPARVRRLIHLILRDNTDYESLSEGEGKNRYVIIQPKMRLPTKSTDSP
ncbi:MAG: R3H domain-containing nucleic acid-binding protein [Elusimicrobiota bacterium]|nr:R3H domain-containing nucleic acid-binding protein [Elusimicrobiota bacterium]